MAIRALGREWEKVDSTYTTTGNRASNVTNATSIGDRTN
jgi:hypothetical protein